MLFRSREKKYLDGKNIALLFEKDSTRTRCSFEVGAHEQGAHVTYLGPSGSQVGKKESMADTARVLSGFFDALEYRGFEQARPFAKTAPPRLTGKQWPIWAMPATIWAIH